MCSKVHACGEGGTWITTEMQEAYITLHEKGLAHSIESWQDGELAGGLYGVALGAAFFGESMFATASDASKTAFVFLVQRLQEWGFKLIDCQMTTEHLMRFGAEEVSRDEFLLRLKDALAEDTGPKGSWATRSEGRAPTDCCERRPRRSGCRAEPAVQEVGSDDERRRRPRTSGSDDSPS